MITKVLMVLAAGLIAIPGGMLALGVYGSVGPLSGFLVFAAIVAAAGGLVVLGFKWKEKGR